jgi:hypothetical protein
VRLVGAGVKPMQEQIILPQEVRVTYVHAAQNKDFQSTTQHLDELVQQGMFEAIPPIVAVRDPVDGALFVYNGNKRVRHALAKGYTLRAAVLTGQEDLTRIAQASSVRGSVQEISLCWFGITDFDELLGFMRLYAAHPQENGPFPEDGKRRVQDKFNEWQREQERELFGPEDD